MRTLILKVKYYKAVTLSKYYRFRAILVRLKAKRILNDSEYERFKKIDFQKKTN